MIQINQADYHIIKNIITNYPYSFYVYGSRAKETNSKFSDLDLCILDETISNLEVSKLKAELEESNLPFTVDIMLWNDLQEKFLNLIAQDFKILQASPKLLRAENNLFESITYLPKILNCQNFADDSICMVNAACNSSMFNIACRTKFNKNDVQAQVNQIINKYNNQPFAWWLGSSDSPSNIANILIKNRFKKETNEYAMWYDSEPYKTFNINPDITIKQVRNKQQLQDFIQTLTEYDKFAGDFLNNKDIFSSKILSTKPLFVSYLNEQPVGNGSLYFDGKIAGIYDIITQSKYRGKGIASNMIKYLINFAKGNNAQQICLSASNNNALKIYSQLGFKIIGLFECCKYSGKFDMIKA